MQEANLYTITVPVMAKTLGALDKILDKAAAHADSRKTAKRTFEEALLNDRIVFDKDPKQLVEKVIEMIKKDKVNRAGFRFQGTDEA